MVDLTAIVLTKNESKNIVACLDSIKGFAKRVVVVDSGSTDDTVNIAKENGANVYYHPFETYARQFNWGLDNTNITTKWVLRIDADERFTPDLREELSLMMKTHQNDDINGFTLKDRFYFMGRCLKCSGGRKRKLMVFKYGIGRIEDRKMDEHTIISSGKSIEIKENYLHYDYKNIDHFVSKLNWYATREMQDYFIFKKKINKRGNLSDKKIQKKRNMKFNIYYKMPILFRALMLFFYNYIFRMGFLDGKEGFIYHFMYFGYYKFLVDAKIYEQMKTNAPFEETGDLK